jgi:acetoin utilization deacetylase AcuC-like enzyme/GNAT superfamily N-acetyltransferase
VFRIRRIFDDLLPIDSQELERIREVLRAQFPGAPPDHEKDLVDRLRNPFRYRFRSFLYVADDLRGSLRGFALLSHDPDIRFWYLDYIATGLEGSGAGVGGALYASVREELSRRESFGLFFECAPDDPDVIDAGETLKQNKARLRFYERFGARPIANTDYRRPLTAGQSDLPYLVYDPLDRTEPLRRVAARRIVRAILEGKYPDVCTPDYVDTVVASFVDDPVELRPPRYQSSPPPAPVASRPPAVLVANDRHDIHHVRERGYVEAPVRINAILRELRPTGLFREVAPRSYPERYIRAVHDDSYVDYLKRACRSVPDGTSVYPYVFPLRNQTRPPKELTVRAGYFCLDTFTPLNANAFLAAKRAVDCVLTAADELLSGERLAYALVRPPGHHAEPSAYGGFCYFNSAAVAAHHFSRHGPVAVLDIDYHHGNGQERVFYRRRDVLTLSIHGHPRFAYPYFSGFEDERGEDEGEGFNLNYPLPEAVDGPRYRKVLARALDEVGRFGPRILVVALGLDPAKGDPTGTWSLGAKDFEANGRLIGELMLPTLVVQEGGYRTRTLGVNARHFFRGLASTSRRE